MRFDIQGLHLSITGTHEFSLVDLTLLSHRTSCLNLASSFSWLHLCAQVSVYLWTCAAALLSSPVIQILFCLKCITASACVTLQVLPSAGGEEKGTQGDCADLNLILDTTQSSKYTSRSLLPKCHSMYSFLVDF